VTAAPVVLVVGAAETGRIDRLVAQRFPGANRRLLAELFAAGGVRIGGRIARKGDRVEAGMEVTLAAPPSRGEDVRPAPDPDAAARLGVLHVDDDVVVIAKPPGMPSQPLRPGERGTAAGGLAHLHPECAEVSDDPRDGGLVHRLDVGTSGALIAARTRAAWLALRAAFGAGGVDKEYLALVEHPPVAAGCDLPLAQRGTRAVVDLVDGLPAHTAWEVVARHGERRLLRCRATTGRMHQVRAHLARCGAPIVGDARYGGDPFPGLIGFFLHAALVRFPGRAGPTAVEAPLPPDRAGVLAAVAGAAAG
jgi:23S rRNA pseudouridine1911/1915/1917 synthase